MGNTRWMLPLVAAAGLEGGDDALVRTGLHGASLATRQGYLAPGAIVALFFLVAQVINRLAFGVAPGRAPSWAALSSSPARW